MLLRKWVFLSIDLLWIEASFHLETITDTVHESQQKAAWEEKGMWNTMMSSEGMKVLKKSPLVKTVWSSEFSFFVLTVKREMFTQLFNNKHLDSFPTWFRFLLSYIKLGSNCAKLCHKLNPSQPSGCQTSPEEGKVTESSGNIAPFNRWMSGRDPQGVFQNKSSV